MKSLPDDYILSYHRTPDDLYRVTVTVPKGTVLVTTRKSAKVAIRIAKRKARRHAKENKS